jgi:hypothetical protein
MTNIISSHYPKPSFVISQLNFSLVWFENTNQFLVVQNDIEAFFSKALDMTYSNYQDALKILIRNHPEITVLIEAISKDNLNYSFKYANEADFIHPQLNDFEISKLTMGKHSVLVYYSSKKLQTIFEAPYVYLKNNCSTSNREIIISEKDKTLILYSEKKLVYTIPKDQFFVLQAQFANKLIEIYHSINKPRWLCAFHGCAVQKNNKTFLLLGDSGAGKSTLSSLLSLSEYRFVSDDLVLMDHDFKVYDNPAAVSVKENAWPIIELFHNEFSALEISEKTKVETKIKFLPLHALQNNTPQSFNLDSLVWVNYSADQKNRLDPLNKIETLTRLIPDTWINPELASAKSFANWAMDIKTYQLNYSDFKTAKKLLDAQLY